MSPAKKKPAGAVRERSPGVWEIRLSAGKDPVTGKYRQVSRTFRGTKTGAKAEHARMKAELARETVATKGTFGHLLETWLTKSAVDLAESTLAGYRSKVDIRIRPALGDVPLDKLTVEHFDTFYADLAAEGLSPATISQINAICRRALNMAVRWRWLDRNPTEFVTKPSLRSEEADPPTAEEFARIITTLLRGDPKKGVRADRDLAALLWTKAALGARRGEMVGLRWRDVDLDRGVVRISTSIVPVGKTTTDGRGRIIEKDTKTHAARRVSLDPDTVSVLRALRARAEERAAVDSPHGLLPDAFVWSIDPDGRRHLQPDKLTKGFKRAARAAGVDKRLHDLRHMHATLLIAAGVEIGLVSKRLGHRKQSTTTDIYHHARPELDSTLTAAWKGVTGGAPEGLLA